MRRNVEHAAWAQVQKGKYQWIAPELGISADKLRDQVRAHRSDFDLYVKIIEQGKSFPMPAHPSNPSVSVQKFLKGKLI